MTGQRAPSRLALLTPLALVAGLLAVPVGAGAHQGHDPGDEPGYHGDDLVPLVLGIEATPDGGILITQNDLVRELRRGELTTVAQLPVADTEDGGPGGTPATAPVNGLAALGRGNFFATTGGLDSAQGAGLWRVSRGNARLVADIAAFEHANDADATEGWKDHACEAADGWTAGPQSNPYQLTALSGGEVLIADAAGTSLLRAKTNGDIDWVAVFPPAYDDDGEWLVQHELEGDVTCYVQPVPTAVDVGPDGAYYVTELSGTPTPADLMGPDALAGLARVWRIEAGSSNVICPSEDCTLVVEGLTSVMDAEFGPDGRFYVVELDAAGWFLPAVTWQVAGGAIKACDVTTGECEVVEEGLPTPGAITFDKRGRLWVVDNVLGIEGLPSIRTSIWVDPAHRALGGGQGCSTAPSQPHRHRELRSRACVKRSMSTRWPRGSVDRS